MAPLAMQQAFDEVYIYALDGAKPNAAMLSSYFGRWRPKAGGGPQKVSRGATTGRAGTPQQQQQQRVVVDVRYHAFSHRKYKGTFRRVGKGQETGSLIDASVPQAPGTQSIAVDVETIDTFFEAEPYIDLLMTDTEGFDYDVFRGGSTFFREGRVGIYAFEMGGARHDFPAHFKELQGFNYSCYFPLQRSGKAAQAPFHKTMYVPSWLRVEKWDAQRSLKGWFNALCIHRPTQPDMVAIMEELAGEDTTVLPPFNHTCPVYQFVATKYGAMHKDGMSASKRRDTRGRLVQQYFSPVRAAGG